MHIVRVINISSFGYKDIAAPRTVTSVVPTAQQYNLYRATNFIDEATAENQSKWTVNDNENTAATLEYIEFSNLVNQGTGSYKFSIDKNRASFNQLSIVDGTPSGSWLAGLKLYDYLGFSVYAPYQDNIIYGVMIDGAMCTVNIALKQGWNEVVIDNKDFAAKFGKPYDGYIYMLCLRVPSSATSDYMVFDNFYYTNSELAGVYDMESKGDINRIITSNKIRDISGTNGYIYDIQKYSGTSVEIVKLNDTRALAFTTGEKNGDNSLTFNIGEYFGVSGGGYRFSVTFYNGNGAFNHLTIYSDSWQNPLPDQKIGAGYTTISYVVPAGANSIGLYLYIATDDTAKVRLYITELSLIETRYDSLIDNAENPATASLWSVYDQGGEFTDTGLDNAYFNRTQSITGDGYAYTFTVPRFKSSYRSAGYFAQFQMNAEGAAANIVKSLIGKKYFGFSIYSPVAGTVLRVGFIGTGSASTLYSIMPGWNEIIVDLEALSAAKGFAFNDNLYQIGIAITGETFTSNSADYLEFEIDDIYTTNYNLKDEIDFDSYGDLNRFYPYHNSTYGDRDYAFLRYQASANATAEVTPVEGSYYSKALKVTMETKGAGYVTLMLKTDWSALLPRDMTGYSTLKFKLTGSKNGLSITSLIDGQTATSSTTISKKGSFTEVTIDLTKVSDITNVPSLYFEVWAIAAGDWFMIDDISLS